MLKINTLRSKFLLSFIVISLAYIVISSFFILNMINSTNNRLGKINFVHWAKDFETMVEPNFINFNYMKLTAQAEDILKENRNDFIMLFDAHNKEIFYKGPDWIKARLAPYKADADDQVKETAFDSQPYYLISLPVKVAAANTLLGSILFGRSNEENQAIISELRLFIIIISAGLLSVSSFSS
ncbi:MAG: hypothetical protein IH584_06830 [Candidatus Aminicenantes bacterium]|nr:hypothetical protein [Candidatus Aminicenantes bacterium]